MAESISLSQSANEKFKQLISQFEEALDEHLISINDNTDEIQSNYAYLSELDNKIAKLNEKIDDIYHILSDHTGKKLKKTPSFEDIDPLTEKEKSVFLNLYSEYNPISYADLAKKMNLSIDLTRQYLVNLMEKGIPIRKIYKNTRPFVLLDPKFKNLQAKKNILKIEQRILL
jgi:ribosomal protein S25